MPSGTAFIILGIAAVASIVVERIVALITNAVFKNSMPNKKAKRYANQKWWKKAPLSGAFFFIFVTQSSALCKGGDGLFYVGIHP